MQPVLLQAAQPLLEAAAGGGRVATGQRSAATDSVASASASTPLAECGQQLLGLLQAALTHPQGGQAGDARRAARGRRRR